MGGGNGAQSADERSYPTSEAREGRQEELPHAQGKGRRPAGATPRSRSGGCMGPGVPRGAISRSRLGGAAVRIPLVQGKEQQLCFAVAAVNRYPTCKVRETQVRR